MQGSGRQRPRDAPASGWLRAGSGYMEARQPGHLNHPGRSRESSPDPPVPGHLGRQLEHAGGAFGAGDYQLWVAHQPALRSTSSTTGSSAQPALALPVLSPLLIPLAALGLPSPQGDSAAALTAPRSASVDRERDRRLAGDSLGRGFPGVAVKRRTRSACGAGSRHLGSPRGCCRVHGQDRVGTWGRAPARRTGGSRAGSRSQGRRRRYRRLPAHGRDRCRLLERARACPRSFPWDDGSRPGREIRRRGVDRRPRPSRPDRPCRWPRGKSSPRIRHSALRAWGGFPVSVFSGLGVATVLTLNAVLSQPIAGYDYLTAKLYRSRIRAFSRRTPSKSLAAPHGRRLGAEPRTQSERERLSGCDPRRPRPSRQSERTRKPLRG